MLDVKTEVENREPFGRNRKKEVDSWFDKIMKVEEVLRVLNE